jgi:hypothetical protein
VASPEQLRFYQVRLAAWCVGVMAVLFAALGTASAGLLGSPTRPTQDNS